MVLHGLTERELSQTGGVGLIEVALGGDIDRLHLPRSVPDIDGYIDYAMRSGFPEAALRLGPLGRQEWLDAYLEHVVSRDVRAAGQVRDPVRLRHYLEVLGLSTAGLPTHATLYQAAGIDQRTADAYDGLLSALYLFDQVPAWSSNRLARLVKRSKRYLVDPALAMSAARICGRFRSVRSGQRAEVFHGIRASGAQTPRRNPSCQAVLKDWCGRCGWR
ncbi:MAG: DUF4143 domain-containing protein [Pseudonocardiaceae bacterium]